MTDKYLKRYRDAIKNSITDDDINIVLDKIYMDGFEDGVNNSEFYRGKGTIVFKEKKETLKNQNTSYSQQEWT